MYLISHSHRFIFVHVPKTAGSSVTEALRPYTVAMCRRDERWHIYLRALMLGRESYRLGLFQPHVPARRLVRKVPPAVWDSYFTFGFVRNPYAWLLSYHRYVRQREGHRDHRALRARGGFRKFVMTLPEHRMFPTQGSFLTGEDGEIAVDFVGRIESLQDDFDHVMDGIGLPRRTLDRVNAAGRAGPGALRRYTGEMLEVVNAFYREDFERFGYAMRRPEEAERPHGSESVP